MRLFGGELGAVYMGHFVAQREKLHSNLLGLHVQSGNWITDANIRALAAGVYAKSSGMAAATGRAVGLMSGRLRLQAYTLSHYRWILLGGLGVRRCSAARCLATQITAELWRPQRRSAGRPRLALAPQEAKS